MGRFLDVLVAVDAVADLALYEAKQSGKGRAVRFSSAWQGPRAALASAGLEARHD
ncbi:MAG TPA: hypothetical protein VNF73_03345 [Candidatus Saccharimonadales bacterium]|nr:hypothetical protein [Candidatus Saccharimonadales bacterium]